MKILIWTVVLVGTLASGAAIADGNELLKHCQSAVHFVDSEGKEGSGYSTGYCVGVIAGVTSLRGMTNPSLPKEAQTCIPNPPPPNIQAARIAVKFLRENPEQLNLDDGILMLLALQRAFPCN